MLTLLGNTQNPAYAHPKLLRCCYDNVYFCGRLIGDLPARGRLPSEDQSMKVYTQEYQEVVAWVENSIDLTEESPSYSIVPTCLVNPDIILPHNLFREHQGLREIPPGRNLEPREYEMDGAQGLIDLDWSQRMPIFHPDDIDRDPRFTQYPFQEEDDLDDYDEKEMEVESLRQVELVMPLWHHRVIPVVPTNAYQQRTLSGPLKLRAHPGAHTLIRTPLWRWEALVWLPEAQICAT